MDAKELKKTAHQIANAVGEHQDDGGISAAFDESVQNETCGENAVEDSKNLQTGKFKNPKELLRAYCQLEKEFTKRSQRLAKLEEELQQTKSGSFENSAESFSHENSDDDREGNYNENFNGKFNVNHNENSYGSNGNRNENRNENCDENVGENSVEDLRQTEQESAGQKNAVFENEEEWKAAVDKFFEKTPSAKAFAKDIANAILDDPDLKADANCLNIALTRVLLDKFRTPEQLMSDGEFLEKYVFASKTVQDGIITRYLEGLLAGKPPYTLSAGGMQCVAPQNRPKSIEEAGLMFLKNNDR